MNCFRILRAILKALFYGSTLCFVVSFVIILATFMIMINYVNSHCVREANRSSLNMIFECLLWYLVDGDNYWMCYDDSEDFNAQQNTWTRFFEVTMAADDESY